MLYGISRAQAQLQATMSGNTESAQHAQHILEFVNYANNGDQEVMLLVSKELAEMQKQIDELKRAIQELQQGKAKVDLQIDESSIAKLKNKIIAAFKW